MSIVLEPIPIQSINIPGSEEQSISITLARLDLIHPHYGGNKWFKLKYTLAEAKAKGFRKILTYGGAYSNHIYATAAICANEKLECIGIIRGEEKLPLNDTLRFATQRGMKLVYLSRSEFIKRSEIVNTRLRTKLGDFYEIPEGGANSNGIKGCMEITSLLPDFDDIICACGTFTTLAGVALSLKGKQKAIGISVLKADGIGRNSLNELNKLVEKELNISLESRLNAIEVFENYHFGGYAKTNAELDNFILWFTETYKINLDHVYTGKMMFAVFDLVKKNYFTPGSRIIVLMSGRGEWNA